MTEIWAHRGASAYAPENSMAAFRLSHEQGADGVELDVHLSADGELVVIHDETVDRTTEGSGPVAALTADRLGELGVPRLAEVFEELRPTGMQINVELKTNVEFQPGIEKALVDLVAEQRMAERVLVSSFNHLTLKTVQQIDPGLRLGLLFVEILHLPWEYANAFGAAAIHPQYAYLQVNGVVELCHAAGVRLHPWTIDDPEHLRLALALGVDAIITNTPDVALSLRDAG